MLYIFIAIGLINLSVSGYRYQKNRVYAFDNSGNNFGPSSWDSNMGGFSGTSQGFGNNGGFGNSGGFNSNFGGNSGFGGYNSGFGGNSGFNNYNSGFNQPSNYGGMGGMSDMSGMGNSGMGGYNNNPTSNTGTWDNSGFGGMGNSGGMGSMGDMGGFDSTTPTDFSSNFFNHRYNRKVVQQRNYYQYKSPKYNYNYPKVPMVQKNTYFRRQRTNPVFFDMNKKYDQTQSNYNNNNNNNNDNNNNDNNNYQPDQRDDKPYICQCNCNCGDCGDRRDDEQDECFKKRCVSQASKCKSSSECSKAMNKAESGICEKGEIDCGNPDVMCDNNSNECKSLWNDVVQCFYSCNNNNGQSAIQCIEEKCNSNGDLDSCNANNNCQNAFNNAKNGKCNDNNYNCDDSNFMCNGDNQCIIIWKKIVSCYDRECDYDSNDNNNNNNNRFQQKRYFATANEAIKRYNRVKKSKSKYLIL